jgi:hypothetical protein
LRRASPLCRRALHCKRVSTHYLFKCKINLPTKTHPCFKSSFRHRKAPT